MSDSIKDIVQIINIEEQRIKNSGLSGQIAVFELARAMDYFFIGARHFDVKSRIGEEGAELYNNGWPYAIKHFYDSSVIEKCVPLFSSNDTISTWADSVLQHSGRINMLRKLLDLYKTGMLSFEQISNNEYQFKVLPQKILGAEYFEVMEFERNNKVLLQSYEKQLDELKLEQKEIHMVMSNLVCRQRKHYIGYSTNLKIDEHYNRLAILEANLMLCINDFSDDIIFNGIKFKTYRNAVLTVISWSLKHTDFCFELMRKYPEINARNILVKFQPTNTIITDLASAIGIELDTAENVLSTLVLRKENLTKYCEGVGYTPPPFIEIGHNQLLYSNTGCMIEPFCFMLKELNRMYPQDWNKAIQAQESILRNDLYELFPKNMIKIPKNFELKKGRQPLTDVDACIIDPANGVIGIFQIKWQEHYGSIMTERSSKKRNFFEKSNKWINSVNEWFENRGCVELSSIIGEKSALLKKITSIRLFVIGKYSAHFSGNEYPDDRAAWGVWPQVLNIMLNNTNHDNPIEYLFRTLKENSPINNEIIILNKTELKFDNKIISIIPPDC